MTSTGRNQPCPCGSGQKYKHCCEDREKHPYFSRTGIIAGIAIAVVLAGGIAALLTDASDQEETQRRLRDVLQGSSETAAPAPVSPAPATSTSAPVAATTQPQGSATPVPQPPGPAPAGKVWSAEHGHWHDAPSVQIESSNAGLTGSAGPGQPQPGLIWNEEHGHYHKAEDTVPAAVAQGDEDAPATSVPRSEIPRVSLSTTGEARSSRPIAPPPGPAPAGKVWSYEHGHWHDANPAFPSGDIPADSSSSGTTTTQDPQ